DLDAWLRQINEDVGSKLLALAKVVKTLEAEADLLEEHARLLVAKAGVRRRRVHLLKRWMQLQMEGDGVPKLKHAFVTVWLQASRPAIDVIDEAAVPTELKRASLRLPLSLVPPEL